jgi:hypothetical protein
MSLDYQTLLLTTTYIQREYLHMNELLRQTISKNIELEARIDTLEELLRKDDNEID